MQGPDTVGDITTHEVGHQWFYGLVGNDQGRDPWLDEGLATWAEARLRGHARASTRPLPIPRVAKGELGEPMTFWTDSSRRSTRTASTSRGPRPWPPSAPPDLVDCALRVYVAQNAYRIATPADLVAAASAVFPDAAEKLAAFGVEP